MSLKEVNREPIASLILPDNGWITLGFPRGKELTARSIDGKREILFGGALSNSRLESTSKELGFFHEQIPREASIIIRNIIEKSEIAAQATDTLSKELIKSLDLLNSLLEYKNIKASCLLSTYKQWQKQPHFKEIPESPQEIFFKSSNPFNIKLLEIISKFEKKKVYYEKKLNLAFDQATIDMVEQEYQKMRTIMYSRIINLAFSTLDIHIPVFLKTQLKYDEKLRLKLVENRKPLILEMVNFINESVKGGENAKELDEIALKINCHYRSLNVSNILKESEVYGISRQEITYLQQFGHLKLIDLHRRLQSKKSSKNNLENKLDTVAFELFKKKDVLAPLIDGVSNLFQDVPISRATSLVYLLYQIENPFMEPSEEARSMVNRAMKNYVKYSESTNILKILDKEGLPTKTFPQEILDHLAGTVDQFIMITKKWKSAWSYFGEERANTFLEMFKDEKYGTYLFFDLLACMHVGKLIAPPQIYSVLKSLGGLEDNSMEKLKKLYDERHFISENIHINYQISGLQRADEYPLEKLWENRWKDLIDPRGIVISMGAATGVIDAIRASKWGLEGPLVAIDSVDFATLMRSAIVFNNEFRFKRGDAHLSESEIWDAGGDKFRNMRRIRAKLPLNTREMLELLRSINIYDFAFNSLPISIIFNQRASALYLHGDDLLKSIKTDLNLLAGNKEKFGLYFLTKGWANRLFVDLVFKIKGADVSLDFLHHTNSFYSSEQTIIQGVYEPTNSILFAENGSRFVKNNGDGLIATSFQDGRMSEALSDQQKLHSIKLITEEFGKKFNQLIPTLDYNFSQLFAIAYVYYKNLFLYVPENIPKKYLSTYEYYIDLIAQVLSFHKGQPDNISKLIDGMKKTNISNSYPSWFIEAHSCLISFFSEIRKNKNILDKPIKWMEDALATTHQTAIIRPKNMRIVKKSERKKVDEIIPINLKSYQIARAFNEQFGGHEFRLFPGEIGPADFVINTILELLGLTQYSTILPKEISKEQLKEFRLNDTLIIWEIRKKIEKLNKNEIYKMDFSRISNPYNYRYYLRVLESIDGDAGLWERVIRFIDQQEVRTMQRAI